MITLYGLYSSRHPEAIRYIGKAHDMAIRMKGHWQDVRDGITTHKCNWMRKAESQGETVEWSFLGSADSNKQANELERSLIKSYRQSGHSLTNATDGGDGQSKGWIPSTEWRRKRSEAQKRSGVHPVVLDALKRQWALQTGRPMSEETKRRISEAKKGQRKGIPKSPETRAKMSAASRGKPKPAEWRANMSIGQQRRRARDRAEIGACL